MNKNQASLLGTGLNIAGQSLAGPTGGLSLVASNLIGGFMNELAQPKMQEVVKKDVNRINPYAGKVTGQHGGNAQESQVIQKQVGGQNAALSALNTVSGIPGIADSLFNKNASIKGTEKTVDELNNEAKRGGYY